MTAVVRAAAACALALGVAGCAGQPSDTPVPPSASADLPAPTGPVITISALNYGDPLTVPPGAQITVVNKDDVPHTVTSKTKGQFDARVAAGSRATFTAPSATGRYPYYCTYHPGMIGVLIVQ